MQNDFKSRVIKIVSSIPKGFVMSYGQIAAEAGSPRAARIVGGIAHFGDQSLPWHRVVKSGGGTASGYPGGCTVHKKHLEEEGIIFTSNNVDMVTHQWKYQI